MDWKLLLIGLFLTGLGGAILWRFRNSRFNKELAPGCAMAGGAVLLLLGVLTTLFGLLFKG
jgi:multisubunit Na+/H+ antiporter MnhG subunit